MADGGCEGPSLAARRLTEHEGRVATVGVTQAPNDHAAHQGKEAPRRGHVPVAERVAAQGVPLR